MREPEYPHPFEPWGFNVCGLCGMEEEDRAPATCEHDPAYPCTTCPPAHSPGIENGSLTY